MKKILCIYSKSQNIERNQFKEVIDFFKDDITKNAIQEFQDDKVILISKSSFSGYASFFELNQTLFYHTGTFYPDFYPSEKKDIHEQKMIFFAEKYFKNGSKVIAQYNGFFNLIIYNKTTKELQIANDPLGLFGIFIYEGDDFVIFCNEYEVIVKYLKEKAKLNINSIFEYFIFGSPQNNKTFFININLQIPGCIYYLKNNKLKIKNISPILKISKNRKSINEIADEYFHTFKTELNLLLKWHPLIPITLTGGADSRMILASMDENERKRREFITWTSPHIPNEENQDILIAKKLASEYNLNHTCVDNESYSINHIDNQYFKNLKNFNGNIISGIIGSESLRFSSLYPYTISEISRRYISSAKECYNYNSDFFIDLNDISSNKKALTKAIKFLIKYFNNIEIDKLRISPKNINRSIKHIRSPYPEMPYTLNYITRSFFSKHGGGAKSSMLMPAIINRALISPFANPKLLKILWGINPDFLSTSKDSLTTIIFRKHLTDFCKISSNSLIASNENLVMPMFNEGKNNINYCVVKYSNIRLLFENSYLKNNINLNKIEIESDINNSETFAKSAWADFLQWALYIENILSL